MNSNLSLTRKIQLMEVDIFKEFKRVCEKYNLRYFAIGGTCIGAVRHAGFIPWDDDIDVAMPFEDYIKFRTIAENELNSPYELYNPYDHLHNSLNFLKVHNVNTAFIEKPVIPYLDRYTGVFIDVMPIYGLPEAKKEAQRCIDSYGWILRKNSTVRFSFKEQKSLLRKILFFITYFRQKTGDYNYYLKKIEDTFSNYSFDDADQVLFGWRIMPLGRRRADYRYRIVFPHSFFADFREVPFEDTTIRIPYDYDGYLTHDFGDYMQLPPEEKRVSVHPTAIIDLNKSYLEYIKEAASKC